MLNKLLIQINFRKKNCYEKDYQSPFSGLGCKETGWKNRMRMFGNYCGFHYSLVASFQFGDLIILSFTERSSQTLL